ncbi:MAG: hypothetical protein E6230_10025 [Paenibacillus dendritiformis]|uniref:hypothetical protein n=1 Tax=Paenibacillus dendritiformis TaxID=130049 RepID=UPI00143CF185|nr:hypothetical protein [Paenibacillus dendritiformis]MDU5142513.1 hypothetical protein [Paenibacillus dendritiformis]NKI23789.1 hypothetical protein [Paenibacillus dendritiformis]NRF97259.1 hypothetical protein [Paenibacillus dendritiformis]
MNGCGVLKKRCWVCTLLAIVLLAGCMTYKKVASPIVDEFRQRMLDHYSGIDRVEVRFAPTELQFVYTMKKQYQETETKEIYLDTRKFVTTPSVFEEVIEGQYFQNYKFAKKAKEYPRISISFNVDGDKASDYAYQSDYNEKTGSGSEHEADGYSTWYYNNYDGEMPVEVP